MCHVRHSSFFFKKPFFNYHKEELSSFCRPLMASRNHIKGNYIHSTGQNDPCQTLLFRKLIHPILNHAADVVPDVFETTLVLQVVDNLDPVIWVLTYLFNHVGDLV